MLAAGIQLQFEAQNDGWVFTDAPRLQHALLNVAWNARAAMPAGGTLTSRFIEVDSRAGAGTTFRLFFPPREREGPDEHGAHQPATMAHS